MFVVGPHPFQLTADRAERPHRRFLQIFQARRGIAELDIKCGKPLILLPLRYWNPLDHDADIARFFGRCDTNARPGGPAGEQNDAMIPECRN